MSAPVPALVTLDVWGVPMRHVPAALLRTVAGWRSRRRRADVLFTKFLGTGDGRTFAPRDADLRHWATLVCWRSAAGAVPSDATWERVATERLHLRLAPLASKGRWSGREPFGRPTTMPFGRPMPVPYEGPDQGGHEGPHHSMHEGWYEGPVAAITRARLTPWRSREFRRAVPAVATALADAGGLVLAMGIGEFPVGLQGTLSVWSSGEALRAFARDGPAHRDAARRASRERWYAEELFARFAVLGVEGTYRRARISLSRSSLRSQ